MVNSRRIKVQTKNNLDPSKMLSSGNVNVVDKTPRIQIFLNAKASLAHLQLEKVEQDSLDQEGIDESMCKSKLYNLKHI